MKFFELVPKTNIDFLRPARAFSLASAAVIGALFVLWLVKGFNLSIEFRGGTGLTIELPEASAGTDIGSVRSAMAEIGYPNATVVTFGGSDTNTYLVTLDISEEQAATAQASAPADEAKPQAAAAPAPADAAAPKPDEGAPAAPATPEASAPAATADAAPPAEGSVPAAAPEAARAPTPISAKDSLIADVLRDLESKLGTKVVAQSIETVGPRVGSELKRSGFLALLITSVGILLYVAARFDSLYAPGAVIALLHDVLITAGMFVLFGLEFDLQVLAALLVVLGYSINDTIVIYDRILENVEIRGTARFRDVVNLSLNETLSRTVLTSFTVLMVVLAMLFFGGPVLRPLSLALTIGVISGTYSTVYIASALLVFLQEYRAGRAAAGVVRSGGGGSKAPTRARG